MPDRQPAWQSLGNSTAMPANLGLSSNLTADKLCLSEPFKLFAVRIRGRSKIYFRKSSFIQLPSCMEYQYDQGHILFNYMCCNCLISLNDKHLGGSVLHKPEGFVHFMFLITSTGSRVWAVPDLPPSRMAT